jgi:hypothetical protein
MMGVILGMVGLLGKSLKDIDLIFLNLLYNSIHGSSTPPAPHGLQRKIRQIIFGMPRITPYFFSAFSPYCEQVGVKRHAPCGKNIRIGEWSGESVR